jgi:hypothetical protein
MAETSIYPLENFTYIYTPITWSWSGARDAVNSTNVNSTETLSTEFIDGRLQRAYLEFDLSSITDTITKIELFLYIEALETAPPQEYNIVYGGSGSLRGISSEYSLYLDKIAIVDKTPVPLSTFPVTSLDIYSSCSLDIINYPTSSTYVVGLVCKPDFLNDVGKYQSRLVVSSITNRDDTRYPYLKITHGGSGYSNTVMGVLSANISTVMGVPTANISKVMGV